MATVVRESELVGSAEFFEPTLALVKPNISTDPFDFDESENAFRTLGLDAVEDQPVFVEFQDACCEASDTLPPTQFICRAIFTAVRQRVQEEGKLKDVYAGLKEVVGDIEKHADKDDTAVIILHRVVGGLALHTFSTENEEICIWKQDPEDQVDDEDDLKAYGRGEIILPAFFRGNYASFKNGKEFERHIFIPDDEPIQLPRIHHDD
jgi:hypothetical protein